MGAASQAPSRAISRLRALFDERDPAGGRFAAALFLVHPGPSLLVTMVGVATVGLLTGSIPDPGSAARITLIVLPAQLATGAANDLADVADDRLAKPHKPLVRRAVPVHLAGGIAVGGSLISLAVGASVGFAAFGFALLGLGAGLAYDVGLKRTPLATIAWWAGFSALPLGAAAVAGALRPSLAWCVPFCGLLAVALHGANALPDIDGDRAAGVRSWPVLAGPLATRVVVAVASTAVCALVLVLREPVGQQGILLPAAALGLAVTTILVMASAAASRRAFPLLAAIAAVLAVAWLGALPR